MDYATVEVLKINYEKIDKKALDNPTLSILMHCSLNTFIQIISSDTFDINQQDKSGCTLLMYMMMFNNYMKFKELLRFNPNVGIRNMNGENTFYYLHYLNYSKGTLDTDDLLIWIDKMLELSTSIDDLILPSTDGGINAISSFHKRTSWGSFFNTYSIDFVEGVKIRLHNHVARNTTLFSLMLLDFGIHKKQRFQ